METDAIQSEILGLEKKYWQAMKDNDQETILKLTDDPCIVTGPQGVMKFSKEDFSKMMNSPQSYKLKDFKFVGDHQVQVLGDDIAVIAYRVNEKLDVDGEPIYLEVAESSTWRRKDGQWVCSLHTEAIAGDPFGRDRNR